MSIPILNRKMILNKKTESTEAFSTLNFVVGRDGFEPSKAKPTDLQSVAFDRSATYPNLELVIGIEPTTC